MRFNLNNPAFLQGAGNRISNIIRMFSLTEDQGVYWLNAHSAVYIDSIKNGEKIRTHLEPGLHEDFSIENDPNTEIVITGDVNSISVRDDVNTNLEWLDVSRNTVLEYLDCTGSGLSSLELGRSESLTEVYCSRCNLTTVDTSGLKNMTSFDIAPSEEVTYFDISQNDKLESAVLSPLPAITSIRAIATNSVIATRVASAIGSATSVDGTVTLRQGDEFNQTIIDAAMDKGWDVQYYAS